MTQLRLLEDVSNQMYENTKNFASDGGIQEQEFKDVLDAIENRVSNADTGSNEMAGKIKENTMTIVNNCKKQVDAVYAKNSEVLKSGGDQ